MHCVELDGITKTFTTTRAVDDLSLRVPTGSVYGFIGPNGSGKTTTLRMLMRIIKPDSGRIGLFGNDVTHDPAASDRVGYLPEERSVYRKMKVYDLLQFFAELKGARRSRQEIDAWLNQLDLAGVGDKPAEALSKGMLQKVQFLTAVLHDPALLILDEPFTGLDPVNMEVLRNAVLDRRRAGATVIFSTHDMDVAEKMCDFIFMIFRGRKVLDGTLAEIKAQYGADTLRVRAVGDGFSFADLPGVERVTDFGQFQELRLGPTGDPQSVLRRLADLARVEHFEIARPSLRDIFVRIARPEHTEATHESA